MQAPELTFRDYLRIIRRRKWWIVAFTVIIPLFASFTARKRVPVYEAEATVKLSSRQPIVTITGDKVTWWGITRAMDTEVEVIRSGKIVEKAGRELKLIEPGWTDEQVLSMVSSLRAKVQTEQVGRTDFILIKVRDTHPARAAALANKLARVYIREAHLEKSKEARITREFIAIQLEEVKERLTKFEETLRAHKEAKGKAFELASSYRDRLSRVGEQLSELLAVYTDRYPEVKKLKQETLEIERHLVDIPKEELVIARIEREVDINSRLYTFLKEKLAETEILEKGEVAGVTFANPAVVPVSPITPGGAANIFIGLFAGLILGLIFAFVSESLDTSIATIDEIESYLGHPVLGVIPGTKMGKGKESPSLLLHKKPDRIISEAFKSLTVNIDFAVLEKRGNSFCFTSSVPVEGKSSIAINCAISMASSGKRVVLVDVDTKRAILHHHFGLKREPGFTDLILREMEIEKVTKGISDLIVEGGLNRDSLTQIPGIDNLYIITSGHLPPNPVEVLSSKRTRDIIEELKKKFDVCIFDITPVLTTAASSIMASMTDWVVIIYEVGRTARGTLRRAVSQLSHARAKVLGVVLNKMKAAEMETGTSYYYHYRYYPGEPQPRRRFRLRRR